MLLAQVYMTIASISQNIILKVALTASLFFTFCSDLHAVEYTGIVDDGYVKKLNTMYKKMSKYSSDKLIEMGLDMFRNRNDYDSAVVCLAVVKNRYKESLSKEEKRNCIIATSASGYLSLYRFHDFGRSYDCFEKALKISQESGIRDQTPRLFMNLGVLFQSSSNHFNSQTMLAESISYYEKGLDESYQLSDWEMYIKNFLYLSSLYRLHGMHSQLQDLMSRFHINEIPDYAPNYQAVHLRYGALKALQANLPQQAIEMLQNEIPAMNGSLMPERYHTQALAIISSVYEQMGEMDKAFETLDQVVEIANKKDLVEISAATYRHIADVYRAQGDDKNFALYYDRYSHLKDSLFRYYRMDQVGDKLLFSSLNKAIEMEKKSSERRKMYIVFALVLVLLTSSTTALAIVYRRKNKYLADRNKLLYDRYHEMLRNEGGREQVADEKNTGKYKGSSLTEEDKTKLVVAIKEALNNTEAICQQSFTIEQMAQMVGSNSRYVSQVINECFGMNFNSLVAEKRVREACRKLDEESQYGHLTIEAVAQSVGFKSRNSLIAAFKKVTGLTPSEYQKMSKEGV